VIANVAHIQHSKVRPVRQSLRRILAEGNMAQQVPADQSANWRKVTA
jgi:hypothetical protein